MKDLSFFRAAAGLTLAEIAARAGLALPAGADPASIFEGAVALAHARPRQIAAFLDGDTSEDLAATCAGACLVPETHLHTVPAGTIAIVAPDPLRAFQCVASALYPASSKPGPVLGRDADGRSAPAHIHVEARLETGVLLDPGVVIGPGAEIGSRTFVGAHAVIGPGVRIGRDCIIDAHVTVTNALIGDRVMLHSGTRIGFAEPDGPVGSPSLRAWLGRVIVQNDVEVGVNAAIARAAVDDTVIGERSVVDSLVLIKGGTAIERCCRVQRTLVERLISL